MKKNVRTAVATAVLSAGLAWTAGSAATGAPVAPPPAPTAPGVVAANAQVADAVERLADPRPVAAVAVVRVASPAVLLEDPRFLANVHRLQDFLNNHDAPAFNGVDVAITDLLAIEERSDGSVVLYTR